MRKRVGLARRGWLRYLRAMEPPQPLTSAIAAERWAVETLRDLADTLETLPRAQKADALRLLIPALTEVDRVATLLGLRK